MPITRRVVLASTLSSMAARAHAQSGDAWPSRPIRLVVPFPPGGSTDVVGRIIAERLQAILGQSVVVDNRGGASGAVGSQAVARMPADGYSFVVSGVGSHGIVPAVNPNPGYDAVKDFTHVGMIGIFHSVLVVHPSFSARTIGEFVAEAQRRPGAIDYATSGNGSSNHLLGELFKLESGIDIVHVPYRGAGPALQAVLANEVPAMCDSLPSAAGHIRAGSLRPIAVSSRQRLATFPDVPTFVEAGYPNVVVENWFGIAGPAGLPLAITERVSAALAAILTDEATAARLRQIGLDPQPMPPAELGRFVAANVAFWADTVRRAKVTSN